MLPSKGKQLTKFAVKVNIKLHTLSTKKWICASLIQNCAEVSVFCYFLAVPANMK